MQTSSNSLGSLSLDDVEIRVSLTADASDSREITVFARVVAREGGGDLPLLVYLQGGPGVESPRPSLDPHSPPWLRTALEHHRVVFLDQRGTGASSAIDDRSLAGGADHLAEYMQHFRADAIVRDCEALREHLGVERWSLLGQSFGGFTALRYVSEHSESLDRVFFTGGLPNVGGSIDDAYSTTYEKMRRASEQYYRRFPAHRERMRALLQQAASGSVVLPDGEVVSPSRVRSLGHLLGSNDAWLQLHTLLDADFASNRFLHDLAQALPFSGRNPVYAVLHESCWADGGATRWAAERVMPQDFVDDGTLFTGEHVRREWFDTVPSLQEWAEVADLLADHDWPALYDAEAIRASDVAGAAAVYVNDVFVPMEHSLATAELMPGLRLLVTSEHEHSGLRSSGGDVLEHLFDLASGKRLR
ncbi:alpha/beta fold hydrolase [Agrococcus casei]|uniref:Putative prolyl aminopeptidase n=1 Tax=Agrococcus casei LMG 22410 TaxID=1255656 RepID=A0A1R4GP98_9MICO|nr:alpha/beta fold hydrolase [Agrococcus casei]SJM70038.1 putative prolyl aminopeptidase [Agrococcus casei LMG 22410]